MISLAKIAKISAAVVTVGGLGVGGYFAWPYASYIPYIDKVPYLGELVAAEEEQVAEVPEEPEEPATVDELLEETAAKGSQEETDPKEETDEVAEETETNQFVRSATSYEKLPQGEYQPWRVVRRLQKIQDKIAAGEPFAQEEYVETLKESAGAINLLDDSIWQYERNLDAMAVFLMFGGATELGYKALQKTKLGIPERIFLEAALSFVERDVSRANALMHLIDHTAIPASMGAQLALAKSMTLSTADLDRAKQYLMEARRLAPGTLVEEAALRRSIRIAGENKSFEDLQSLYRTYLHRFAQSYYFNDYVRNVGFAAVRMPAKHEQGVLEMLDDLVQYTDPKQTASIAVYVARYAAISGRKEMAEWSEAQTTGKLRPNSKLHTRMKLYAAASRVVQADKAEGTMEVINAIDDQQLRKGDVKILNAVRLIGKRILAGTEEIATEMAARRSAPDKTDQQELAEKQQEEMIQQELKQNPTLSKASALFAEIEQLDPESIQ